MYKYYTPPCSMGYYTLEVVLHPLYYTLYNTPKVYYTPLYYTHTTPQKYTTPSYTTPIQHPYNSKSPKIFRLRRAEKSQNFPPAAGRKVPKFSACGGQRSHQTFSPVAGKKVSKFSACGGLKSPKILQNPIQHPYNTPKVYNTPLYNRVQHP